VGGTHDSYDHAEQYIRRLSSFLPLSVVNQEPNFFPGIRVGQNNRSSLVLVVYPGRVLGRETAGLSDYFRKSLKL
jgi:hypothetical protein